MPKVRFQPAILEIRGTMYDVVFKRSPQGKMIVTKRPDMSHVQWSEPQKDNRRRFKLATAAVREALADPGVRARYDQMAQEQDKRAWDLAMSDHLQGKDLLARERSQESGDRSQEAAACCPVAGTRFAVQKTHGQNGEKVGSQTRGRGRAAGLRCDPPFARGSG